MARDGSGFSEKGKQRFLTERQGTQLVVESSHEIRLVPAMSCVFEATKASGAPKDPTACYVVRHISFRN
jgi:hypothetical protein